MAKKSPRDLYRSMHSGLEPRVRTVPAPRTPKAVIDLRRMTAVEGIQLQGKGRVQGSGPVLYRHEFKGDSGPMMVRVLGRDTNNMDLVGGNYRINDEGMIEDKNMSHHRMRRYTNPESTIAFLALAGLALAATGIVQELVNSMLPASWSANKKMVGSLGIDALLIVSGAMLFKKSPVWGIALAGSGVMSVTHMAYTRLGLDAKVQHLFHRTPAPAGIGAGRASGALPDGGNRVSAAGWQRPAAVVNR